MRILRTTILFPYYIPQIFFLILNRFLRIDNKNLAALILFFVVCIQYLGLAQNNIRFAVIGDYGDAGTAEAKVANLINSWNVNFIITAGDNNYPDGEDSTIDENIGQYFHQYIYPYVGNFGEGSDVNRFFPTLGNHDWNTKPPQPYYDYFELPNNERYYDFVWGNVQFFAIDSDSDEPDGVSENSTQGQWLKNALAVSTKKWRIVYFHHSPYSSSQHGSQEYMQWPYKEWGASAVMTGHDHVYERITVDGFPYFVNGLGGRSKYSFDTPIPGSQVRYNEYYGAMLVEAYEDSINFKFISVNDDIIDSYTLSNVIPVELISFTGILIENKIHLIWLTATELNNYGFEIFRSHLMYSNNSETEATVWKKIGFLPGHGTTTEKQSYYFIDESVMSGNYQYRLKQIDYDGSFEYSNIVEVEVKILSNSTLRQNYPNPFNPNTVIKYQIPKKSFVTLKVYDVLGNEVVTLVNEEKAAGGYEVMFKGGKLTSGIYFYQFNAGSFVETKKMVLMK